MGIWGMILGGSIYAQSRRWIQRTDLLIVASVTLGMVLFFPFLRYSLSIEIVLVVTILAGASMVAVTALFRLIYGLLSRMKVDLLTINSCLLIIKNYSNGYHEQIESTNPQFYLG